MLQIQFRSSAEKEEILKRGLEALQLGQVSQEALELGGKFKSKIESSFSPKVSIRYIDERIGSGAFAEEDLKANEYIGEYTGIVRENSPYLTPLNNYCYEYPVPDFIGRSYVIDATQGNFTRFINHSRRPNLKPIHVFVDGFYHLIFLSIRNIEKGEQLSYDYGAKYWYIRSSPEEI